MNQSLPSPESCSRFSSKLEAHQIIRVMMAGYESLESDLQGVLDICKQLSAVRALMHGDGQVQSSLERAEKLLTLW